MIRGWPALLLLIGCGAGPEGPFIAFARDFEDFRSWESWALPWAPGLADAHLAGPRTVFLSARPPRGSKAFPVGTRIVKTVENVNRTFAMAKRGDRYNAEGAVGWEWFELGQSTTGTVALAWRGLGPPSGEAYFGDPAAGCNGCHVAAAGNDYVQELSLSLSKL